MGLLDLQTDLKSLKYGQDRPNGGSSGQPYIQTDIRTVDATFGGVNLTLYDDGLVRGGMVAATNASATDTIRLTKFFLDFPKGPLFITKQVGLQLSNPQLEQKGTTTERYIGPSRIYNLGINTLAQIPLTAFGEHIVRHGILPISEPNTYYEAVVTSNNFQSNNNRLEKYTKKFSLGGTDTIYDKQNWNTDLELNRYVSGPNSSYGIGNTIISRYTNTNDKTKIDAAFDRSKNLAGHLMDSDGNVFNNVEYRFQGVSNFSSSIFISGSDFALGVPLTLDDRNAVNNINEDKLGVYKVPTTPVQIVKTVDFGISNQSESMFNGGKSFNLIKDNINENTPTFFFVAKDEDRVNNIAGLSQETKDALKVTSTSDFGLSYKTSSSFVDNKFNLTKEVNENTPVFDFIANNKDNKKHNRNEDLPPLNSDNDLVSKGPSTFPGASEEGIAKLDLPQTAYKYANPNLRTYTTVSNQNSKVTKISQNTAGGKFTTQNVTIDRDNPKYQYNTGAKITFNRGNDTNVDEDALALIFKPIRPFTGAEDIIKFLGYITDYSDSFDSGWTDIKYVGRAEKFYVFNEFKRSISLGFNIPCFNKTELDKKHTDLNQLASILAGEYNNGLLGGIITKLTVGNYIADQPGIITSLNFSPIDDSSWDLDSKLAFYIKVSLNFTLIHDGLQQYKYNFIHTPTSAANTQQKKKAAAIFIGSTVSYPQNTFGGTRPAGF